MRHLFGWSGLGREVWVEGAEVSRGHSTYRDSFLGLVRMPRGLCESGGEGLNVGN